MHAESLEKQESKETTFIPSDRRPQFSRHQHSELLTKKRQWKQIQCRNIYPLLKDNESSAEINGYGWKSCQHFHRPLGGQLSYSVHSTNWQRSRAHIQVLCSTIQRTRCQDDIDYKSLPACPLTGPLTQCDHDFENPTLCVRSLKGLGHVRAPPENLRKRTKPSHHYGFLVQPASYLLAYCQDLLL